MHQPEGGHGRREEAQRTLKAVDWIGRHDKSGPRGVFLLVSPQRPQASLPPSLRPTKHRNTTHNQIQDDNDGITDHKITTTHLGVPGGGAATISALGTIDYTRLIPVFGGP